MNRFIQFTIPTALLLFFGSCTVQDHQIPSPDVCHITEEVVYNTTFAKNDETDLIYEVEGKQVRVGKSYTMKFEYDDQGRGTKLTHILSGGLIFSETRYEYTGDEVKIYTFEISRSPQNLSSIIPTNAQGLYSDPDLPIKYFYNAEGFLTEIQYGANTGLEGSITKFTIEDGNIVKQTHVNPNLSPPGVITEEFEYEFDLTKPNPSPYPFAETIYGKHSRSFPVKTTYRVWNAATGKIDERVTNTDMSRYTFDARGYVTKSNGLYFEDGKYIRGEVREYKTSCQ